MRGGANGQPQGVEWGAAASPDPNFGRLRVTERRESFVMRAIRCPRGSSSARADLIETTSPPPGGARRRGRHGAHSAMHEASCRHKPGQPPRERHSRGCFLGVGRTARTSTLMRAPRRSPPTDNRRSRRPRAAPTRTKLLPIDRWSFPSDSQPDPRRDMVHRPSAAPSPGTAASRAQSWARRSGVNKVMSRRASTRQSIDCNSQPVSPKTW